MLRCHLPLPPVISGVRLSRLQPAACKKGTVLRPFPLGLRLSAKALTLRPDHTQLGGKTPICFVNVSKDKSRSAWPVLAARSLSNFRCKVLLFAFDSFTQSKANETGHLDGRANVTGSRFNNLGNLRFVL